MKFKGIIYIHKNKINGKCYVGQTTRNKPSYRWGKNGIKYKGCGAKFWNAIQKYGWNNFDHIILPTLYKNQEELNHAEIQMIEELDSYHNGYNSTPGGDYNYTKEHGHKKSSKELMIKAWNDERKDKLSKRNKNKIWTNDQRNKVSNRFKGLNNHKSLKVSQYDKNMNYIKTFDTIVSAGKELDIDPSSITKVCKGKYKTAGGYIFIYGDYKDSI